jgi:hypothetical protein
MKLLDLAQIHGENIKFVVKTKNWRLNRKSWSVLKNFHEAHVKYFNTDRQRRSMQMQLISQEKKICSTPNPCRTSWGIALLCNINVTKIS